ncbi:MAG: translational repressor RegA [Proteobacteria bacterium]|nr:translational repressor RegA [Pseudomonadota bacterium]
MDTNECDIENFVEIELLHEDDFLKVKETLTRIGVSSRKENKLYQSCHILHKRGRYYIVHFKELFELDGLETDITENDIGRRNTIANLLEEWELLDIVNPEQTEEPVVSIGQIKILAHKDKDKWELVPKYHIGNSKR